MFKFKNGKLKKFSKVNIILIVDLLKKKLVFLFIIELILNTSSVTLIGLELDKL